MEKYIKGDKRNKRDTGDKGIFSFVSFVPSVSSVSSQAFTLIELIVVFGIIAVLSAMLITIVNPFAQFAKARDAQRKSDLGQIQRALEQYYQDTGSYPLSNNSYQIIGLNAKAISWGENDVNDWPYMNVLPQDADTNRTYVYYSTGQIYYLYASLEQGKTDPQACNKGNVCATMQAGGIGFPTAHKCSPTANALITCNYGVTSPNTTP